MRRSVLLVEGSSDAAAVHACARRRGQDLVRDGIEVIAVGGFGGIAAALAEVDTERVAVLCDAGEASRVAHLVPEGALHVCDADLEDEFIRALGVDAVEAIIAANGDGASLEAFRRQPAQRGRPADAQLRRFLGTKSGRKLRYAALLADALSPEAIPVPIIRALDTAYRAASQV
jgi:hypothetical protein